MVSLLTLPSPRLTLPDWDEHVPTSWAAHTERAIDLTRGAGTGRNFDALLDEARALLKTSAFEQLIERAGDRRFQRAVFTVWRHDPALARTTMSPQLLAALPAASSSRLTTITMGTLVLEHFDHLERWTPGLFVAARDLVRRAVSAQRAREHSDIIESFRRHSPVLFELDGPGRLAAFLAANGADLPRWFRENHLLGEADSRFGRQVRDALYLEWISRADAENGDHSLLETITTDVVSRQRTEETDAHGLYFGHYVLRALTEHATRYPSTAWLDAVLAIGGDPRKRETEQWRMWWSRLPAENLARAIRWMRGVDLKAFLDGVEQYAHDTQNADMERMLERRKQFLLGLYEQDRVDDVRLILGDDVRRWFRRSTHLPVDALRLTGSAYAGTAIVYVDCGDFALVEGSHSFKLHVYTGGPVEGLTDSRTRSFSGYDLRTTMPVRHASRYGSSSHIAITHFHKGDWLRQALDYLRECGVRVDERALMSPNDFADLSRRRAAREW